MDFQIAPATFINDIIRIVDNLTANFIQSGFEAIVSNWVASGLLTSILTVYILYFLYQVKFYNTPITDATIHLIKVCLIFLISTNWSVFYILIFNVTTNEPLHILQILLKGKGATMSDGSLNDTFITGIKQAIAILANMPFSFKGVLSSILAAILLILGTFLFTMLALSFIIISKFYLAVYLTIAPYFLMMFLFNGTKGLSESWVKSCLNYALVPVFVGCVLLLTTTMARACLGTNAGFGAAKAPDFMGAILYLFTAILSAFLIKTVPEAAASLTSSLAIASAGRMASYAKQTAGSTMNNIGSRMKNGVMAAKNDFAGRQQKLHQGIRARAETRRAAQEDARARRARSGY